MKRLASVILLLSRLALADGERPVYCGNEGEVVVHAKSFPTSKPAQSSDRLVIRSIATDARLMPNDYVVRFIAIEAGRYDLKDYVAGIDAAGAKTVIDVVALSPTPTTALASVMPPAPGVSQTWRHVLILATLAWAFSLVIIFVRRHQTTIAPSAQVIVPVQPESDAQRFDRLVADLQNAGLDPGQRRVFDRLARQLVSHRFGRAASGPIAVIERWLYCREATDVADVEQAAAAVRSATGTSPGATA